MEPREVARIILAGVRRGRGEIIVARGRERATERLRRYLPERAFAGVAAMAGRYVSRIGAK